MSSSLPRLAGCRFQRRLVGVFELAYRFHSWRDLPSGLGPLGSAVLKHFHNALWDVSLLCAGSAGGVQGPEDGRSGSFGRYAYQAPAIFKPARVMDVQDCGNVCVGGR